MKTFSILAGMALLAMPLAARADIDLPPATSGNFQYIASDAPSKSLVWLAIGQSFVADAQKINFSYYLYNAIDQDQLSYEGPITFELYEGDGERSTLLSTKTGPANLDARETGLFGFDFSDVELTIGQHYTVWASAPATVPVPFGVRGESNSGYGIRLGLGYDPDTNHGNGYPDGDSYMLFPGGGIQKKIYGDLAFKVTSLAPGGAVPEPATWALMIGGFALAGAALRRKRLALEGTPRR